MRHHQACECRPGIGRGLGGGKQARASHSESESGLTSRAPLEVLRQLHSIRASAVTLEMILEKRFEISASRAFEFIDHRN
jgi:hypothetical protein